jgi:glycosyltransferase involved in cell wall biosynthesis
MTKYISFAGWGAAVGPYFAQADVFVLSSHYEGFPYVLLEAMQYGLPIIATDTPYGPSEALHDGKAGVLVTPADFPALANAMIRLAQNTALYEQMRNASFTQARYFSEEKMLSAYNRVFRSLVE